MKVNGKEKNLPAGLNVSELLEAEGYDVQRVAVELNGDIVARAQFENTLLSESDIIEIVHFVGGG